MSFFEKIKNRLSIGGVKLSITIPEEVKKSDYVINGKIHFTTKSDQDVVSYSVKLVEELTIGRGNKKKTHKLEIGKIEQRNSFIIKTGEQREISFDLPFELLKSNNEELKEKGGALGVFGQLGSFVSNEQSKYFVVVDVVVNSAFLDPMEEKREIRLV